MRQLVISDMRLHAARWLWTLMVAGIGSASLASILAVAVAAWSAAGTAEELTMVQAVTGNAIGFTVIAGCAVIASTAGLVVRSRAREHALWKTIGVPGDLVGRVVLAQLASIGLVGGLVGALLVVRIIDWLVVQWSGLGVMSPAASPSPVLAWLACPLLGAFLCTLGGLSAARRAARVTEMEALREAQQPTTSVGLPHAVVAILLAIGLVSLPVLQLPWVRSHPDFAELPEIPGYLFGSAASLIVMMIALALAPLTLRWAVDATTRLPIPGVVWQVAGATARLRAASSTTMTLPFALAMSIVGVAIGTGNLVSGEVDMSEITVAFGLVFFICWAGGVANIALLGRERTRDSALCAVTGARPGQVAGLVIGEGVLHAASAFGFALVLTTFGMLLTGFTAGMAPWTALARGPWRLLGLMGLGTLATTVFSVALPALANARRPALEQLRMD